MRIVRAMLALAALALGLALPAQAETHGVRFDALRGLLAAAPPVTGSIVREIPQGIPVIVTFFASWCPPCTPEFRHLNEVRREVPASEAAILGINAFENWGGAENPARMKRFLDRTTPDFPLLRGNQAILDGFGGITRIPTVIVFDGAGKEVWRFVHINGATKQFATTDDIFAALEKAKLR